MPVLIEVLSFDGCPHSGSTLELVERVVDALQVEASVRIVNIPDVDAAVEHRFLGSPTIRVNGRDVEPGADERTDYTLACRIYASEHGLAGQPDEKWVRDALRGAVAMKADALP